MKKNIYTSLFLLWLTHVAVAQSAFIPKNLGAGINTTYDEINPVLSPDGKTLYFSRLNHPSNTYGPADSQDIWFSKLQADGTWSAAERVSGLNIGRYSAVYSVSADGNTLLLNGVYNNNGSTWKKRGLSTAFKMGDAWSTPARLKVKGFSSGNRGMKSSASMSADGKTIVFSFAKGSNSKRSALYLSELKENGKWTKPKKIAALASPASDDAPFLLADNKTLYFSSNRGAKGDYDVYTTTRTGADWKSWSTPKPLNDTINSAGWESYFKTSKNGSTGYFSTDHNSLGGADIFKVKVYEDHPFVIAHGEVQNSKSLRALKGKEVKILVDGKPADSVWLNADSGTYRLKLPLKKKYNVSLVVPDYKVINDVIDVSTVREFTNLPKPLKAEPLPYVLVKGKLFIKNTNNTIPAAANAKIVADGEEVDSAFVNKTEGTYEVKLNHGTLYYMQVSARRFESFPEPLDLNTVDEYREITLDLLADAEKMAIVSGKVIDKKTGKPLIGKTGLKIMVEGIDNAAAAIDSLQGTYDLRLPLKRAYVLGASAPDYYPISENIDVSAETGEVTLTRDLVLVPIEVGQSIRLNNIFFDAGKSVLKPESFPELDRVALFLEGNPDIKVEISGHTDNVGKAATNQKLSAARAKAVTEYVVKKGIAKERIVAKGYGMAKPVTTNKTPEGKAQNRRVEFTILKK
ncbi:OmpA family protein [Chryseolinea lacunae]|uniref:OmpA family protein n=1 Tax=Chryseolinea lacunae TaxID=2801331 RepID=A0ABS1KSP2_9BACT|nr:OmpA family protein [Chryseolinea lacunae]MBL0742277.1 OmpA family protein [Chryseolinea lacunae]